MRPLDVSFVVQGIPIPQGSHQAFPIARGRCKTCKKGKRCGARNCFGGAIVGCVVTDQQGHALDAWRQTISVAATSARNVAGMGPVRRPNALEILLAFVMPRPGGHWTESGALTKAGRDQPLPTVKPDFDKLTRACADSLSNGVLVEDDAEIIMASIAIFYAGFRGWTGVAIEARQTSTYDEWAVDLLVKHNVWTPPSAVQGELL